MFPTSNALLSLTQLMPKTWWKRLQGQLLEKEPCWAWNRGWEALYVGVRQKQSIDVTQG